MWRCSEVSSSSQRTSIDMFSAIYFIFLVSVVDLGNSRPSSGDSGNRFPLQNKSEEVRSAAIKRLLEVFGIEDPPTPLRRGHKQPPQYMLDLYNTVADVDGVTKDPSLLEGNTVRSFFDKCKLSSVPSMMGSHPPR